MKKILLAAALLLGPSAVASAHAYRVPEAPAYSATASVSNWRFALPLQSTARDSYRGQHSTLTGGPSGGPNQS